MSQQKKPHFCHHYETSRHTRPNCYKWLATEQSNSVLSSGGQDHTPPSLGPLRDLLKALMFLLNLNSFNFSPLPLEQRFTQKKGPSLKPKVWKEKGSKWFNYFFSLSLYVFALLVCFAFLFLSQSSFMLCVFLYIFVRSQSSFCFICFS